MNSFRYENHQIECEETDTPTLKIDGEPVDVQYDKEAQTYNSTKLPYSTHNTVEDLAKSIVAEK